MNFLSILFELKSLFDLGVEIIIGEDSISITGRDYAPIGDVAGDATDIDNAYMERPYDLPIKYEDDSRATFADTLTPLIEKIRSDTLRLRR